MRDSTRIRIYILLHGQLITEGSPSHKELDWLTAAARKQKAKDIAEIGFNAGFGSLAFLAADPDIRLTSFDIGTHRYTKTAKKYIDKRFPGRHTLIYGDSKETLPRFARENPGSKFDLIFVDGGHDYETAKADIENSLKMLRPAGALVIDDLTPWLPWGKGPTKAWTEVLAEGKIIQEELWKDGVKIDRIKPFGHRVWALGRLAN